jgi:hypothetical protein
MASWPFLRRPGERSCPELGIAFDGIGAAREEQPHQLLAAPSACPSERRAFQDVIADIETSAGIGRGGGDGHALLIGDVIAGGDDLVQDRRPLRSGAFGGAGAFENHLVQGVAEWEVTASK